MVFSVPAVTHARSYVFSASARNNERPHRALCVLAEYLGEEPDMDLKCFSRTDVAENHDYHLLCGLCRRCFRSSGMPALSDRVCGDIMVHAPQRTAVNGRYGSYDFSRSWHHERVLASGDLVVGNLSKRRLRRGSVPFRFPVSIRPFSSECACRLRFLRSHDGEITIVIDSRGRGAERP